MVEVAMSATNMENGCVAEGIGTHSTHDIQSTGGVITVVMSGSGNDPETKGANGESTAQGEVTK